MVLEALTAFASPGVIDDAGLKARFQKGLEGLVEGKDTPSLEELNRQLSRKQTKVDAPAKKSGKFPSHELYDRCKSSVLMIGRIYKCDKCTRWHAGSASAFAISSDGIIATNYHVIEEKNGAALGAMDLSGKTYAVTEVLAASKADDAAILRLKDAELKPLPLALGPAAVGTSDQRNQPPRRALFYHDEGRRVPLLFIPKQRQKLCPPHGHYGGLCKGSSGGPVLNVRGEVGHGVINQLDLLHPRERAKPEPANGYQVLHPRRGDQ